MDTSLFHITPSDRLDYVYIIIAIGYASWNGE